MTQLVTKVVARAGTMAERVVREMQRVNIDREDPLNLVFDLSSQAPSSTDGPHLFLEEAVYGKVSRSYSLRYQRRADGAFILPVGKNLPDSRIGHVATSILAMVARGADWKGGHEAYGPIRTARINRGRRRRARQLKCRGRRKKEDPCLGICWGGRS